MKRARAEVFDRILKGVYRRPSVLRPGGPAFEYMSGTELGTARGTMSGSFEVVPVALKRETEPENDGDDDPELDWSAWPLDDVGEPFDAIVAPFSLAAREP